MTRKPEYIAIEVDLRKRLTRMVAVASASNTSIDVLDTSFKIGQSIYRDTDHRIVKFNVVNMIAVKVASELQGRR